MSLLQRNDQAYPEYGDVVKLVKEVKEVNLACANHFPAVMATQTTPTLINRPLAVRHFLPPAGVGGEESI
ncbi:hypothetical protein AB4Y45_44785 [Paraburkholderia sp. EG287A]|uniref:hypothetical protein n=1 Tax=unclassified Paraburkholderia TaxID=2615204 RepID=UPI0034D2E936